MTAAGRAVLVVGASSGIGRATAQLLASQGARLVIASRSAQTLEQVAQECRDRGAQDVLVVPTDIRDAAAVDRLLAAAVARLGRVDGVVHTAAVLSYGRFTDLPVEVFDRVVDTNIRGSANLLRSVLATFDRQGGGSLVVLGSVLAKMTSPALSSYATSKWGLQGLVRTLQVETRGTASHVSLVSPGSVDTPIYDLSGSYTGRRSQPPPPVSTPERLAREVVRVLDHPQRDRSVGLANRVMELGFRLVPGLYDVLVGPSSRLLTQARSDREAGPGNVFEPVPELEAVRGRRKRRWRR
jgi:short-subunit dehydrogenase